MAILFYIILALGAGFALWRGSSWYASLPKNSGADILGQLLAMLLVGAAIALIVSGREAVLVALLPFIYPYFARWYQQHSFKKQQQPAGGASAEMTKAEALEILGLAENCSEDDILAAHIKLMSVNHPDRGGSAYLAARINAARDLLLS